VHTFFSSVVFPPGAIANMALPERFSLLHSDLNGFLFAPIGKEESGVPLSVLSALTRLDLDPWAEGARLTILRHQPHYQAFQALSPHSPLLPLSLP
jgi:hypothetical protein